jgi:hypothetical protein
LTNKLLVVGWVVGYFPKIELVVPASMAISKPLTLKQHQVIGLLGKSTPSLL